MPHKPIKFNHHPFSPFLNFYTSLFALSFTVSQNSIRKRKRIRIHTDSDTDADSDTDSNTDSDSDSDTDTDTDIPSEKAPFVYKYE
jgi:hypothetical protein